MNGSQGTVNVNSTQEPIVQVTDIAKFIEVMEYHLPLVMAINKCLTPIWYVVGGIGNLISARNWLNPRMKACNSSANYLAALAISDFIYLFLHIFYELENPWLVGTLDLPVWCELWNVLYMSVQYMCVLLVLAFTIERFVSVCFPLRSERFSRKSRSSKIIFALILISVIFGLPQAYFWQVSIPGHECFLRISELKAGKNSFYSVYSWGSEMLMFGIVPLIVLMLNICVLVKMRSVGNLKFTDSRTNQAKYNIVATTITLLCVSFYLILTTLPVTITFAIQNNMPLGPALPLTKMSEDPTWRRYFAYYSARTIIREICLTHHACNVVIYGATSKRFLKQVRQALSAPFPCATSEEELSTRQYALCPTPQLQYNHATRSTARSS